MGKRKAASIIRWDRDIYTEEDMVKIARRIWWGKFPHSGDHKVAYPPYVGVSMRRAVFPIKGYRWERIGDWEFYIQTSCRGDFQGTIGVRPVR
jgi:hypothetical protein